MRVLDLDDFVVFAGVNKYSRDGVDGHGLSLALYRNTGWRIKLMNPQ